MDASVPPSASSSHYSSTVIGFLIGAVVFTLLLISGWIYVNSQGGPSNMIASFRKRRKGKGKASDIEAVDRITNANIALATFSSPQTQRVKARTKEEELAQAEALALVNNLMATNKLVGHELPPPPPAVNSPEERQQEERLKRIKRSDQLRAVALAHEGMGLQAREKLLGRRGRGRIVEKIEEVIAQNAARRLKATAALAVDPLSQNPGGGKAMGSMCQNDDKVVRK